MATDSNIPAGRIPWTKEPGGLQAIGLQRVGHVECLSMHITPLKSGDSPPVLYK